MNLNAWLHWMSSVRIRGELEIVANYNTTASDSGGKKHQRPEQGISYLPAKNINLHFMRLW
jgi:hypothetical protein